MKSVDLVKQELEDLKDEFSYIETPIDKMNFIIDLGKEGNNNDSIQSNENEIQGCVSTAYINIEIEGEELHLSYFADALIVQGFLAIICDTLEETSVHDLNKNLELIKKFSMDVGLQSFLSPNRSNALFNIFRKIENSVN